MSVILKTEGLNKVYRRGGLVGARHITALNDVNITVESDKPVVIAVVGESGSGKTTLAKTLLWLETPTSGRTIVYDTVVAGAGATQSKRDFLGLVQPIFQNPFEAFSRYRPVDAYLHETARGVAGMNEHQAANVVAEALDSVGLNYCDIRGKYTAQLSGGELQRISVARALIPQPKLIIADEPVSMIDASRRMIIINLFKRLRDDLRRPAAFRAHTLSGRIARTHRRLTDQDMTMTNTPVWDIFELRLSGPSEGNPYLEVTLEAHFTQGSRSVRVPGFYDGDGQYILRFMPDTEGDWHYETQSPVAVLSGQTGRFTATASLEGAHGPVQVANQFHFAHADGKPFLSFGTTCYAWTHQPLDLQAQTLYTLATAGFNKIRMGVFPKDYPFNTNEPVFDVFELGADGKRDFDRPNPVAFRHFETQIGKLRDMGIEADIIIFHPYDRWGYCEMSAEQDNRYVAYLAARLAAYSNVWWSLANEYDFLLDTKPMEQWDRFFHILKENDPYGHLRSIHNGDVRMNYDHTKPWVTHVCIQNWDVKKTPEWRDAYGKPVINDEPEYEGNIFPAWGNISAQELTHRFWITALRGGYAGHGETFEHPEDIIWWAKGGKLYGEAWKRIKFLRELLEEDVRDGLTPLGGTTS